MSTLKSKIRLGTRPKNFRHTLEVPLHGGDTGTIEVSYIYRTRKEFGAFVDQAMREASVEALRLAGEATAAPPAAEGESPATPAQDFLFDQIARAEMQVAYILRIADGWNLDVEFNRDNVAQLCDELPGAARRIIEDYREALTEGRLGN